MRFFTIELGQLSLKFRKLLAIAQLMVDRMHYRLDAEALRALKEYIGHRVRQPRFSWQLTAPPGNQVRLIDEDYTPTAAEQVGSGGVQRFTFETTATGSTSLAFGYVRPWETGVAPAQKKVSQPAVGLSPLSSSLRKS